MQRFDKYTVQTLGFALIVIGIFLFVLSLIAGPYRYSGPPCAYPGCPPSVLPWYWWLPSASFFLWYGSYHRRDNLANRCAQHETQAKDGRGDQTSACRCVNRELCPRQSR